MISALALAAVLSRARDTYAADIVAMAPMTGRDVAYDYVVRLDDDIASLSAPLPAGVPYTADEWRGYITRISTLDDDVVGQYLARTPHPLGAIRGLGTTLVRASADGTMQPVAVYVPPSYDAKHPAALVIFLHGREQTESQLLAKADFARLADSTGSIVIAPYGRGYYDFRGSATTDIYDAVAAAKGAFAIDPRREFLAGYSMGGFSVFEVGVVRPTEWAALMCVSGGLFSTADAEAAARELRTVPLYALTGARDADIPTTYTTASAGYLRYSGMPVSYYQQADGTHRIESLRPILDRAWDDMHHGVVRQPPPTFALGAAPPQPPSGFKP